MAISFEKVESPVSSSTLNLALLVALGVFLLGAGGCGPSQPETLPARGIANPIPNPFILEITGSNKTWSARYPSLSGSKSPGKVVPATRGLHLPRDTKIILLLKSTDYVYTFAVPQQELKEIAVPSLEFRMAIRPTQASQLDLVGEGLCGDPHTEVPGRLIFEPPGHFLKWQQSQP